jgi:hypothetical protein
MESMAQEGWLFVRDQESIWITQNLTSLTLVICGPGSQVAMYPLRSFAALNDALSAHVQRLIEAGWDLHPLAERRQLVQPLSSVGDRRLRLERAV